MSSYRFYRLSMLGWGALIVTSGCERSASETRKDPVVQGAARATGFVSLESDGSGWNTQAGPVLLLPGETRDDAIVLLPLDGDSTALTQLDTLATRGAKVSLFGRGGARFTAQLGAQSRQSSADCRLLSLHIFQEGGMAKTWSVGLISSEAAPLVLDSVDALSSRDSMALAAEASRLASAVTAITAPSFQGLRFTAYDIRRFEAAPGVHALVAHLIRRVNQEANPQEEQTLLIAERDSGVTTGPYRLAYAERTHGLEEQATTSEVLAGVSVGGRPTLIVARDNDKGVAYALVERTGPRRWRPRWTSRVTRCE